MQVDAGLESESKSTLACSLRGCSTADTVSHAGMFINTGGWIQWNGHHRSFSTLLCGNKGSKWRGKEKRREEAWDVGCDVPLQKWISLVLFFTQVQYVTSGQITMLVGRHVLAQRDKASNFWYWKWAGSYYIYILASWKLYSSVLISSRKSINTE